VFLQFLLGKASHHNLKKAKYESTTKFLAKVKFNQQIYSQFLKCCRYDNILVHCWTSILIPMKTKKWRGYQSSCNITIKDSLSEHIYTQSCMFLTSDNEISSWQVQTIVLIELMHAKKLPELEKNYGYTKWEMYYPYREKRDQQHLISNNIIKMEIHSLALKNWHVHLVLRQISHRWEKETWQA
jgi:hypothetical protein